MATSTRRLARPRFTLLLLIMISITVITLDFRGKATGIVTSAKDQAANVLAPVQSAAVAALAPVSNFAQGVFNYGALEAQNARLRSEVTRLQSASTQAAAVESQARQVLSSQHLSFAPGLPKVEARVISSSPSNFAVAVVIDRGQSSGVAVGMPVVTGAGLLGRVVQASSTTSTVLLLTDPSSNIGVRLVGKGSAGPGAVGVAVGQGAGKLLHVELLSIHVPVAKGQLMVTSGLQGSIFPPGLPVGRVSRHSIAPGALSQAVDLAPVVNPSEAQYVSVLLWSPKA